ncbi:MAG: fibronectin/fibrinogen-binding protein [Ruminococcaceae bacterium]|nr:fibronectin/fibrinogen-binding protein [Oscillospiraceae bacterium]
MPFDALYCSRLAPELKKYVGSRVDKIFRPEAVELDMLIYTPMREKKFLIISASMSSPRVSVFSGEREHPSDPDSFIMLMRKHLVGARITDVFAVENERVIVFDFDSADEMGYIQKKRIYAEIMGKHSNIILCDSEDVVISALYQSDITSPTRRIMAGLKYEEPPKQQKRSPKGLTEEEFAFVLDENADRLCHKVILDNFLSFSPLVAKEVVCRAFGNTDVVCKDADKSKLFSSFCSIFECESKPCIVYDGEGKALEISFVDLFQYDGMKKEYPESLSEALNIYYEEKSKTERIAARSRDLTKTVKNVLSRLEKKLEAQKHDLFECAEKEECRRAGDAIIGSIYMLKQGMETAELADYENGGFIKVKLDKRLSPSKNAERYYKKYAKMKRAEAALIEQISQTEKELEYMESVSDLISRLSSAEDFEEMKDELSSAGYLKGRRNKGAKKQKTKPLKFVTAGGFVVKVGKNNVQNDFLTFGADKNDYWFHVKNIPGSHTVLYTEGMNPSDEDLTEAATIAAKHSKATEGSVVSVDYTLARYVKKPPHSKPGYVTYDKYKTAYIKL